MSDSPTYSPGSAAEAGYSACEVCMYLSPVSVHRCENCGSKVHPRIPYSVQKTVALLITAIIAYLPANIYPIMTTTVLGHHHDSTIISGVILFAKAGDYFVAAVIFIASVFIPVAKIIALLWLSYNAAVSRPRDNEQLIRLYAVTEFIGKWSMVDVFVVSISAALAQIGNIINIKADVATVAFAIVVISSMLAAFSLDTRLIWDRACPQSNNKE